MFPDDVAPSGREEPEPKLPTTLGGVMLVRLLLLSLRLLLLLLPLLVLFY